MHQYWRISPAISINKCWRWTPAVEYDKWLSDQQPHFQGDYPPPSAWPNPAPLWHFSSLPTSGATDAPYDIGQCVIVSARLREFFEREAPQQLTFYPVRVHGPGSDRLPAYYVVRFDCAWDCLHPYAWDEDSNGRFVAFPLLARNSIPVDSVIGCVKHFGVLRLMRSDLKRKLLKEGFTGFDFYAKADFVDDGSAPMFEHVNQKRPWPGTGPAPADGPNSGSDAVPTETPPESGGTAARQGPKNGPERKRKPKGK